MGGGGGRCSGMDGRAAGAMERGGGVGGRG